MFIQIILHNNNNNNTLIIITQSFNYYINTYTKKIT